MASDLLRVGAAQASPPPTHPAEPPSDALLEELANRHELDLPRPKAFLVDLRRSLPEG